ncbi:phospholipase D-like domain-containing protein [Aliarcobacter skirrowii]|uniref:phospholipase D-like domain-containing protein n=1 Tax=Aliarcobacter skirrowii TaxID=28200 RepID=UPI000D60CA5C|nr:phospholipase D-like domain-containing protein [Aliarcobacter skirrowii]PWE21933.1 nuclease [Aliarcobacter skirrowii]PWE24023.1 nuclease [Aliarcobacter skirrowii]RJO56266.1 nuclease [Aliarcobacter skirrowii]RJO58221.1 nuclease [Aliarcobacter skirrowii]
MKKIIFLLLFVGSLVANDIFVLPKDSKKLEDRLSYEILNAKKDIFIAMYNFSYKKIANDLIYVSKNGVKITVLLDKSKVKEDDEIYKFLKSNDINVVFEDSVKKMHLKTILIDDSLAIIGSMNFTKKSFKENLDIVYFSNDDVLISKLKEIRANFK